MTDRDDAIKRDEMSFRAPEDFKNRWIAQNHELEQILGKALGYPWYKDDQKNFPGTTETDGVCTGDNTVESLAMEAAERLRQSKMGWKKMYTDGGLYDPSDVDLNSDTVYTPVWIPVKP